MNPFKRRVFGVRLFEVAAFACVLALAFGVYLAKTNAGRERARIANIDRQIAEEQRKTKLLRAEVAHLEQPERLGRLSNAHLGLQPADGTREALPETLPEIARPAEKKPRPAPSNLLPKPEPVPVPVPEPAPEAPTLEKPTR
ncbi:MAG: cell division protein [Proteobacteria bacterium]|nr:cell division protein [Pseudomonadota bacterium]